MNKIESVSFICPSCQMKSGYSLPESREHLEKLYAVASDYKCPFCGQSFESGALKFVKACVQYNELIDYFAFSKGIYDCSMG